MLSLLLFSFTALVLAMSVSLLLQSFRPSFAITLSLDVLNNFPIIHVNVYSLYNKYVPTNLYLYSVMSRDRLDLTTFFSYLSKITINLPDIYLSKSKITR